MYFIRKDNYYYIIIRVLYKDSILTMYDLHLFLFSVFLKQVFIYPHLFLFSVFLT